MSRFSIARRFLSKSSRAERKSGETSDDEAPNDAASDGEAKLATVDRETYLLTELPDVLGVLCHIVDAALAELGDVAGAAA